MVHSFLVTSLRDQLVFQRKSSRVDLLLDFRLHLDQSGSRSVQAGAQGLSRGSSTDAPRYIAAVTLMTLAGGVYGQWYYNGPNAPQLKGANRKAFGRAATTSLGSVAFGSLIVTVLEIIKQLLNALSRQEAAEGDGKR